MGFSEEWICNNTQKSKSTKDLTSDDYWEQYSKRKDEPEFHDSGISFHFSVVTEEEIRQLAYLKWEQAGKPEGNSDYFWNLAEQELNDCS